LALKAVIRTTAIKPPDSTLNGPAVCAMRGIHFGEEADGWNSCSPAIV
jgi:hypothetical protein